MRTPYPLRKIFQTAFVLMTVVVLCSGARAVSAAGDCGSIAFIPSVSIPGSSFVADQPTTVDCTSIGSYVKSLYTFSIYVAAVVAAIVLMVGGFLWLTAGGNANQVGSARTYIGGALSGFILLLLSWTLLQTINPALTSFRPLSIRILQNEPLQGGSYQAFDGQCPKEGDPAMSGSPAGYYYKPAENQFCGSLKPGQVCCMLDVKVTACGTFLKTGVDDCPAGSAGYDYKHDSTQCGGSETEQLRCCCKKPKAAAIKCCFILRTRNGNMCKEAQITESSIGQACPPAPSIPGFSTQILEREVDTSKTTCDEELDERVSFDFCS